MIIQKLKNLLFKMVKFAAILCNGGAYEQKMNLLIRVARNL